MATGSPVSFWYGTRAQFDSIATKLDTTLYFITDEQALYKGTVKFSGSGVDTLLTISATEPTASSVTTGDKYFNTTDNLIHVLLNDNGTVSTTATYEPANGALYYNANAQRFQTLIKDGSSYIPTEIYDAGISVEDGTGLVLNGTTIGGLDATTNSKGVVQVGDNLNVSNGVVSAPTATNARFGVVKSGDNITNNNGVLSVGKATTSALGVVKVGSNINVDNNGQISVPVADGDTKGVTKVGANIDVADGVISVKDASTSDKGVVQLVNNPDSSDMSSETKAITPHAVGQIATTINDAINTKQDNLSNGNVTTLNTAVGAKIDVNVGDGLAVGVAGSTNANKLITNNATVEEILTDSRAGVTTGIKDRVVEPHDLKGALSVGQAVDVSCAPPTLNVGTVSYSTDVTGNTATFLDTITYFADSASSSSSVRLGWRTTSTKFPKYTTGLRYLFIFDFTNTTNAQIVIYNGTGAALDDASRLVVPAGETKRIAKFLDADGYGDVVFNAVNGNGCTIKNWRQYEVTALTDEAIAYIAQLENPDAFFRSTSAYSIRNKYLIKQDMVCPFIPTINMPDNSDLTVASGLSYKVKYTNDNTHTITADTIPTDAYGWDTHIQMFIKGTAAINFQAPLVLMDALTPNAGHNLSIKWRNGDALVYVDDTNAGYIVVKASGTGAGTLNDAISNDYTDYVIFSGDLAGTVIDAGDATFAGGTGFSAVNILGNGTDKTTITGNISATSGNTINFQSLTIDGATFGSEGKTGNTNLLDVTLQGGTRLNTTDSAVRFQDVTIPSGSTVTNNGNTQWKFQIDKMKLDGVLLQDTGRIYVNTNGIISGSGVITGTYNSCEFGVASTIEDITIRDTVSTRTFVIYTGSKIINCLITGNTSNSSSGHCSFANNSEVLIVGSTFTNNIGTYGYGLYTGNRSTLTMKDCVYGDGKFYCETNSKLVLGNIKFVNTGVMQNNESITVLADSIIDCSESTANAGTAVIGQIYSTTASVVNFEDNITLITVGGTTAHIDACRFDYVTNDAKIKVIDFPSLLITTEKDVWDATNFTFFEPIDAGKPNTIKLTGTTFTGAAKTLNASRIQLPNGSTNSFSGNTNPADTKILDAGLIVVGDNPASPSGTATVINASGASSTVSGIGTYIDKEGDNDFVANNTTNVKAVDASTTGAKYLGTVLSATTGDTGANRFAKIDSGAVAVVNEATNAVNKQIITHDYEPILGGTFSLTSATVNEATKTVAIQSGGTMSIVDIRGGKDSVIDLGGTYIPPALGVVTSANGVTITGGSTGAGGAFSMQFAGRMLRLTSCTLTGNRATNHGGAIDLHSGNSVILSACTVSGNSSYNGGGLSIRGGAYAYLYDSVVSGNTGTIGADINIPFGTLELNGSNAIGLLAGTSGTVTISSGAILDLTGNENPTPINPGGGITFESGGATVLYSSGAVSGSYMMDNVSLPAGAKLTNTAVVDLGTSFVTVGGNQTAIVSGVTLQNGQNGGLGAQIIASSGGSAIVSNTVFTGASGGLARCVAAYLGDSYVDLTGCTLTGSGTVLYIATAEMHLTGCDVQSGIINTQNSSAYLRLHGSNHIAGYAVTYGGGGHIEIADGAIVDFTGNSNSYVFYPANFNGTISYGANVTVITSAGDSVSLNGGTAGTCARLKNDGTTE